MKLDDNGTVHHVETFEEHQRLRAQRQEEKQIAQQLIQQQQNQLQFGIDQERQRPGGQLELQEGFASGSNFQSAQSVKEGNGNNDQNFHDANDDF